MIINVAVTPERTRELLERVGAMLNGHFVLRSGLHSLQFIAKDAVCTDWEVLDELCLAMVEPFVQEGIEVIASPATAGVGISQSCARALSRLTGRKVLSVWADKVGDDFEVRRVFPAICLGKKVLCAEDILTKGDSAAKAAQAVRAVGGNVCGVTVIVNRGGVTAEKLGVPNLHTLLNLEIPTYEPGKDTCPGCRDGLEIVQAGGVR